MKIKLPLFILLSILFIQINTVNAESEQVKTDTFNIEKMTCKMCHITIKMAIEKVDGVKSALVDYNTKTATVNYDPTVTNFKQIALASTNAGYPATLVGENSE